MDGSRFLRLLFHQYHLKVIQVNKGIGEKRGSGGVDIENDGTPSSTHGGEESFSDQKSALVHPLLHVII